MAENRTPSEAREGAKERGAGKSHKAKAWSVLVVSTLAFTVCFMVWMMFGVIGVPIKKTLNLNSTESASSPRRRFSPAR